MRVISPKQQNDHFGGEHHRLSRLPVSPFSCFCGVQKGKMKRYLLLLCVSWSVCEASSGDKKYPYTLISVALLLMITIIIKMFCTTKSYSNPGSTLSVVTRREFFSFFTLPIITLGIDSNKHAQVNYSHSMNWAAPQ